MRACVKKGHISTLATELALQGWMEVFKNEIEEVIVVLDLVLK